MNFNIIYRIYKIMNYYLYWAVPMGSYGFYRGMKSSYKHPFDLTSHKILCSFMNGFIYASPFGIFKLIHLIDRIEIFMNKKNRFELYQSCYEESNGINHNIF